MPVTLADARLPAGLRIYAVGDAHGETEAMGEMRRRIDADIAARPPENWREVWLGDYVDRGPDSRGAIELLSTWPDAEHRVCLRGNHDDFVYEFLESGDPSILHQWLSNGGIAALASYGVDVAQVLHGFDHALAATLRDDLERAMPPDHRAFLQGLLSKARFGDFGFVHAGIRPNVAWAAQAPHDLTWIRDAFLDHPGPHEVVVVHGHTPVRDIEVTPVRIGIDTGCGKGGTLSAIVIEDGRVERLGTTGPEPLEPSF